MPQEKVTRGDLFNCTAKTWNEIIDAKNFYLRMKKERKQRKQRLQIPTDLINVKNITGANRAAGEVLEVGDFLLTDVKREYQWFEGDTPSHAAARSYCILCQPIPCGAVDDEANGKIDFAQVSGVCLARVNIVATTDRYAYVETSSHVLKSTGFAGPFELLGPRLSTGEQDAIVRFTTPEWGFARLSADLDAGSSATARVWEDIAGTMTDTGLDITVYDRLGPSGEALLTLLRITWKFRGGKYYVDETACDPDTSSTVWGE